MDRLLGSLDGRVCAAEAPLKKALEEFVNMPTLRLADETDEDWRRDHPLLGVRICRVFKGAKGLATLSRWLPAAGGEVREPFSLSDAATNVAPCHTHTRASFQSDRFISA